MNITRCSIISRRRAERDNGERCFSRSCVCGKRTQYLKKREKNIICLMCVGHMMHMKHMKFEKGFFERTAGENAFQRMGDELLPPPAGRSPSLEEGGLGGLRARSKPRIQPRVQGRDPARFKGGYGVPRGFKGEKSKSPPNPLGLAERRSLLPPLRRSPSLEEGGLGASPVKAFRPCCRLHIGALRSPL